MNEAAQDMRDGRGARGALCLAIGGLVLYLFGLVVFNDQPIEDEFPHLRVVQQLCGESEVDLRQLPMAPVYHTVVSWAVRWFAAEHRLTALRAINAVLAVGAVLIVNGILKRLNQPRRGELVLLFAWNPFLFPFSALAYTDGPALFCLVCAWAWQLRRRHVLCGAALAAACLIRQSNLAWVAFTAGWALYDMHKETPEFRLGRILKEPKCFKAAAGRIWPHLAAAGAIIAIMYTKGGLTFGASDNRPEFNPAQYYLLAVTVIVLWGPLWIELIPVYCRDVLWPGLRRVSVCGYLVGAPVLLVREYYNPHRWNRYLDDAKNWALVGMTQSIALRTAVAVLITALIPVMIKHIREQPRGRLIGAAWIWSLLYLAPHFVADVRYYIVPFVLVNLLTVYKRGQVRRLTAWFALLSLAMAISACWIGDYRGGIW